MPSSPGLAKDLDDLLQRHCRPNRGGAASGGNNASNCGIDQRAGVDAAPRLPQQPLGLDGQQLRISRSGADKVNLHGLSASVCTSRMER